ncbi:MAG TPA: TetR/AcrR family transcriptional regulator C-terminal domain-containing protein [Gaiellaceae bacterium]|nr:TetR/AcrR family transcriptional regulator C-terminal domain-containing protein [Gaiellaceae bacterium]
MATSRRGLTRDRILAAALELADAHGLGALSMRKLGESLGFEAMSLYRHVANKDDLLGGMLDVVLAEWEPPSEEGAWDEAIRASAISVHDALARHPWAATVLMSASGARPARIAYLEALLRRLREAGFPAHSTYHAYHALDAHIFGFSLWEQGHSGTLYTPEDVATLMRSIDWPSHPYLAEHRDQHLNDGPHRAVRGFEFGLDLILDGLRKLHG